ncbi:uncharacterized protein LOC107767643 [Nicotiana tabacum]|uniref:Uncharacterized protein LOC107767643 n=1 Tax=Nicotiana tabacum TaxID=4097 RepID=A0AC58TCX2_TOBAC
MEETVKNGILVFAVNGQRFELPSVDPSTTLLEFLRSETCFKSRNLGCCEGFKKEQVKVQLCKLGILKISGQRPVYKWQRFQKDILVSENCDKSNISARFVNGNILCVKYPKLITSEGKKDKKLPVSVSERQKKEEQATSQKTTLKVSLDNVENAPAKEPVLKEEPKTNSPKTNEQTEPKSTSEDGKTTGSFTTYQTVFPRGNDWKPKVQIMADKKASSSLVVKPKGNNEEGISAPDKLVKMLTQMCKDEGIIPANEYKDLLIREMSTQDGSLTRKGLRMFVLGVRAEKLYSNQQVLRETMSSLSQEISKLVKIQKQIEETRLKVESGNMSFIEKLSSEIPQVIEETILRQNEYDPYEQREDMGEVISSTLGKVDVGKPAASQPYRAPATIKSHPIHENKRESMDDIRPLITPDKLENIDLTGLAFSEEEDTFVNVAIQELNLTKKSVLSDRKAINAMLYGPSKEPVNKQELNQITTTTTTTTITITITTVPKFQTSWGRPVICSQRPVNPQCWAKLMTWHKASISIKIPLLVPATCRGVLARIDLPQES